MERVAGDQTQMLWRPVGTGRGMIVKGMTGLEEDIALAAWSGDEVCKRFFGMN